MNPGKAMAMNLFCSIQAKDFPQNSMLKNGITQYAKWFLAMPAPGIGTSIARFPFPLFSLHFPRKEH